MANTASVGDRLIEVDTDRVSAPQARSIHPGRTARSQPPLVGVLTASIAQSFPLGARHEVEDLGCLSED